MARVAASFRVLLEFRWCLLALSHPNALLPERDPTCRRTVAWSDERSRARTSCSDGGHGAILPTFKGNVHSSKKQKFSARLTRVAERESELESPRCGYCASTELHFYFTSFAKFKAGSVREQCFFVRMRPAVHRRSRPPRPDANAKIRDHLITTARTSMGGSIVGVPKISLFVFVHRMLPEHFSCFQLGRSHKPKI